MFILNICFQSDCDFCTKKPNSYPSTATPSTSIRGRLPVSNGCQKQTINDHGVLTTCLSRSINKSNITKRSNGESNLTNGWNGGSGVNGTSTPYSTVNVGGTTAHSKDQSSGNNNGYSTQHYRTRSIGDGWIDVDLKIKEDYNDAKRRH